MRWPILSALAVATCASAAVAADLPSRRAPLVYVPPRPAPAFTWSGLYFGANVGGGFDDYTTYGLAGRTAGGALNLAIANRPRFYDTNKSGVIGGGQIGYNLQLNNGLLGTTFNRLGPLLGGASYGGVVAGIEADADYTDFHTIGTSVGAPGTPTQFNSQTVFLATVRGRLGYAFGNLLLFGTGGFAYGGVNDDVALDTRAGVTQGYGGVNRIQTGYAYGGGIEYAIPTSSYLNLFKSSAVTLKVEYLHYVLGDDVGTVTNTVNGNVFSTRILNDGNLVRAGINYKIDLNPAPAPVVARY